MISKTDYQLFLNHIAQKLSQNLNDKIITNLSRLLALDYNIRLKASTNITEHLNVLTQKLQNFLEDRIIDDDNFSVVMLLFTIAISPYDNDKYLQNFDANQNKNIGTIADFIVINHFSEHEQDDLKQIKSTIIKMLKNLGINEVFKFIKSNAKTFKLAILNVTQQNAIPNQVPNQTKKLQQNIDDFINKKNALAAKIDKFKQSTAKFGLIFGSLSIAAFAVFSGGVVAPLLLVPALLIDLKTAPKLGVILGHALIKADYNIKVETKKLDSVKSKLFIDQSVVKISSQKESHKNDTKNKLENNKSKIENINHLKDTLSSHLNKEYSNQQNNTDLNNLSKQTNKYRSR